VHKLTYLLTYSEENNKVRSLQGDTISFHCSSQLGISLHCGYAPVHLVVCGTLLVCTHWAHTWRDLPRVGIVGGGGWTPVHVYRLSFWSENRL